jgi:predicted glutamine amidotransferase
MCGLFGWSGLKPGVFNKDKFNMLGVQNIERGKHSCGVSVDGEIYVGVQGTKLYTDFLIKNYDVLDPKRFPVVLGHTRHATVGLHTAENAHPFGFGVTDNDENGVDFKFIGVHNGSLLNHRDLAVQYGIDIEVKSEGKTRFKIDSEILLEILYKTKNFKVLSEYNGAAALKWHYTQEPDVVYYYHGMSCKKQGDKEKEEERPLFYWRENKHSLYTSSIEDSLLMIGGTEETVGEFEHNTVYKVTNGDIDNAVKFRVSRSNNWQRHGGVAPRRNAVNTSKKTTSTYKEVVKNSSQNSRVRRLNPAKDDINIYTEELPVNANEYRGVPYLHKLRYWRNGHKIQGFWVYVERYGFVELADTLKAAESAFWKIVGKVFIKGEFKDINQVTDEELQIGWIPFKNDAKNPIVNPPIETFYDGIRIEKPADLIGCINMEKVGRAFDIPTLSLISKHPVVDLVYASTDPTKQEIYLGGDLYTGRVTPMGSSRVYDIKDGNLVSVIDLFQDNEKEETKDLIAEVEKLSEETKQLQADVDANNKCAVDNDFMENFLKKVFDGPKEQLKQQKAQLKHYLPNRQAQRAIAIIDHFSNSIHNLLEIEELEQQ